MGRLFWKTLLGFLATYIAASFGVLPAFSLLRHQRSLSEVEIGGRLGPIAVELCRRIVVEVGPGRCGAAVSRLIEPQYAARLRIIADDGRRDVVPIGTTSASAVAAAPDGRRYLIVYQIQPGTWPLPVPFEVFLLGCVGSLAFSAVLVGYVVAPLRRIRGGFGQLAAGNLTARVGNRVGRRRDEIADLARDFDIMASRLERLVAARDRLLHDVSHELRSPLSRLQMAIALARQNRTKLPSSLDRIDREAQRLNQMVDELLALARVEGGLPRADEHFDLRELMLAVVEDVSFEAAGKAVVVEPVVEPVPSPDGYAFSGSSELVRRAMENVLRNAVKFSAEGQSVGIRLHIDAAAELFVIHIADGGPGVAEALLPHVFDPFVTSSLEQAGVGLGLSIAQRAVRAHHGEITARNGVSGGLLVNIVLPMFAKQWDDSFETLITP